MTTSNMNAHGKRALRGAGLERRTPSIVSVRVAQRVFRGYCIGFAATSAFLCCCSETPIDALTIDSVGGLAPPGEAGTGGASGAGGSLGVPSVGGSGGSVSPKGGSGPLPPPPDPEGGAGGSRECPEPVSMVWVGSFSIRSSASQLCLHGGPETPLATPGPHETAYALELTEACSSAEWELVASRAPVGSYIVRSQEIPDRDLDIEFGATDNGTPAILYAPVSGLHQRFYFRERMPSKFEIMPAHTTGKCLGDTADGLEISTCTSTNEAQAWELITDSCKAE
jgi:hypothetical protein